MNSKIRDLFNEVLFKYKNSQTIVIMNDSGGTHKKLAALDEEIDAYAEQFRNLLDDSVSETSADSSNRS